MAHPIVHIEIPATDTKAAGAFYGDVFGWQINTDPSFDYTMFAAEGGPGGGFVGTSGQMPAKIGEPLVYIGTEDIEATLRTIEARGGKTVAPKTEIPGVGWFAIFTDPSGNRMALYTAVQRSS
jgi:predicted enzyme related to lactoylglutathione lyase